MSPVNHDGVIAVCDACVLYPAQLRNVLVQMSVDRVFDAKWSMEIQNEWIRNLLKNRADLSEDRLRRHQRLMDTVLPSALVNGYQHRIAGLALPDANDRHVLAAALEAGASVIATWNLRDFPQPCLEACGVEALTPDALLTRLYHQNPRAVIDSLARARANLSKSNAGPRAFLELLVRQGLTTFCGLVAGDVDRL